MPRAMMRAEKFFPHLLQQYRLVKRPKDEYSVKWANRRIPPIVEPDSYSISRKQPLDHFQYPLAFPMGNTPLLQRLEPNEEDDYQDNYQAQIVFYISLFQQRVSLSILMLHLD